VRDPPRRCETQLSNKGRTGDEPQLDWDYAHEELMAKQGIDLKAEMAKKLKEIEEQFLKEKLEAHQAFQQERKVMRRNKPLQLNIAYTLNCASEIRGPNRVPAEASDGAEHDYVHDELHDSGRVSQRRRRVR
jgi:hypothetical protein